MSNIENTGSRNFISTTEGIFFSVEEQTTELQSEKFFASDSAASRQFGRSVGLSTDGTVQIIGSSGDDLSSGIGSTAYIRRLVSGVWIEEAILSASDGSPGNTFGWSADISGDGNTAVVGAYNTTNGDVYVYKFNGISWDETKLSASDGASDDEFGYSVSISEDGNTIIVGAQKDNNQGSAYVYKFNGTTWDETKLTASDAISDHFFGQNVAISADGDSVVVGATGDTTNGASSGAAYVYKFNGTTWDETKLLALDGTSNNRFGFAVSISANGEDIVVGADGDSIIESFSGAAYIFNFNGTSWEQRFKLKALDPVSNANFGHSVSMSNSGSEIIIGANRFSNPSNMGATYYFKFNGSAWDQIKILPPDIGASKFFGSSSAISGDGKLVLAGAPGDSANAFFSGAAYLLSSFFTIENKLGSSDITSQNRFGNSVAISADKKTIAVGANEKDDLAAFSGAAYVFNFDGLIWNETKLSHPGTNPTSDKFGTAVDISEDGTIVVVSAPGDFESGLFSGGSVTIFRFDGISWVQEQKIFASDSASGDEFGISVAISSDGTTIMVGSRFDDDNGSSSGSAYVFRFDGSTWIEEQKLTASDAASGDQFGISVAISADGNTTIIGSFRNDEPDFEEGSAYIFRFNGSTWIQEQKLLASNAALSDRFGTSVAISSDGSVAAIGAPQLPGGSFGAVYMFKFNGSTWIEEQIITPSGSFVGDQFGSAIAISADGNTLISSSNESVITYIFQFNSLIWTEVRKITEPTASSTASAVAISSDGNAAVMGSNFSSSIAPTAGSVHVYDSIRATLDLNQLAANFIINDFTTSAGLSITLENTSEAVNKPFTCLVRQQGSTSTFPNLVSITNPVFWEDGIDSLNLLDGEIAEIKINNVEGDLFGSIKKLEE